MAKPLSNPTSRVLQVLEYLAMRPAETYGLSELARSIGISKSTCLSILNTLVDSGYVTQHPVQRYYSLGPAAIAVGQAALVRFPNVSDVLPILRELSRDIGMGTTVEALAGDQLLVVASVGQGDPLSGIGRTGVRLPFAPPYGAPFAANIALPAFREYLNRAEPALPEDAVASLIQSLDIGRRRGYFIGLDLPEAHPLHGRLTQVWNSRAPDRQLRSIMAARVAGYMLDEIDDAATYQVASISAPVRSRAGAVEIALAILALGWKTKGKQLRQTAEALSHAAERVTEMRGG